MDPIVQEAHKYGLSVIEDAAQACGATYRGRSVGTIGDAGCFSISSYKRIGAGEELVQSFRKLDPNLPIVITAPHTKKYIDLQQNCPSASTYLMVPFTTEQLRKTVSEYVPSIAG